MSSVHSPLAGMDEKQIGELIHIPKEVLGLGGISDAQLEAVVLAEFSHKQMLPGTAMPKGMIVGDGTGVGKGREIAAIMLNNWHGGSRRMIWFTKSFLPTSGLITLWAARYSARPTLSPPSTMTVSPDSSETPICRATLS